MAEASQTPLPVGRHKWLVDEPDGAAAPSPAASVRRMTGGQVVAQALSAHGAAPIFSVSGNQILPVYDAAADWGLRIIHMRHESAAAYAAAASAEVTGRPGVVLVSAGPGFVAALTGIATAKSMELPVLFLSGATAMSDAGHGGFQDLDQGRIVRPICKASFQALSWGSLSQSIGRAWRLAQANVPGPVHVSLPADVLSDLGPASPPRPAPRDRIPKGLSPASESALRSMAERLSQAQRPLIIARPSAGRGEAGAALRALALELSIEPVITVSPRGMNDLKYRETIRDRYQDCDCALVVGPADFTVGFLSRAAIAPRGALLHIDTAGDPRPRRVPDIHARVSPALALSHIASVLAGRGGIRPRKWASDPSPAEIEHQPADLSGRELHPLQVAKCIRDVLEPGDVVVLDGGEFCQWVRLGLRDLPNAIFWNGKLGAIGGSIAQAVGVVATGHGGRTLAVLGDGAAGYHLSEFETAVRYGLRFVAVVGNDARWGAEWHLQVSRYGHHRTYETSLQPVRYDEVAAGFGAMGFHAGDIYSLREALAAGIGAGGPACVNVTIQSVRSPAIEP